MDIDDCFYNDLSLLVDSPNDYGITNNSLDELIDSTVSNLDSSLDLNTFIPQTQNFVLQNKHIISDYYQTSIPSASHELDFSLDGLSPFSSPTSSVERTPSTSSGDGSENFDDFLNFLNDDTTKIDKLGCDSLLEDFTQERNTPSPTGSYSSSTGSSTGSSSGSSTSGVHSDISDVPQTKPLDHIDIELATHQTQFRQSGQYLQQNQHDSSVLINEDNCKSIMPETAQILPKMLTLNAQPTQSQNNIRLISKISKLTPVTPVLPLGISSKVESQSELNTPKHNPQQPKQIIVDASSSSTTKPKTIFLSAQDYKALLQKMNSNSAKGAKIDGCVNAQVPKIVMKNIRGKVLGHSTTVDQTARIIKTHESPARSGPVSNVAKVNATTSTKTDNSNRNFRGLIDEKMYKKQQRMIKNRESASLSRKKKKEYVVSLESRINRLEKENYTLKGENGTLRNQLVAFAKTCKCSHGNASEFVLNSLNAAVKDQQQDHVRIAPKPKCSNHRMNATTVKKNVAVLFAMAFMVTLNAGNFQSYLNKQNMDEDGAVLDTVGSDSSSTIGRRLLWVETEEEYNENLNRSKRESDELVVPPLHFLYPTKRGNAINDEGSKNNSINNNNLNINAMREPPPLVYPNIPKCNGNCNSIGNQTEYTRIANNLQKWANGNDYFNLSMNSNFGNEHDNPHGFKLSRDYLEFKPEIDRQTLHHGKRTRYMDYNDYSSDIEKNEEQKGTMETNRSTTFNNKTENIPLFNVIKRQDDTLYVLSFNMDHIMLPASSYNKGKRPKMSLLLPTGDPTPNGDIMLMQVDCEVFNTKELELKSHMIPPQLRSNISKWHQPNMTRFTQTEGTLNEADNKLFDKLPKKYEKPRVRTFFMVGPKNQAAAAASQEKPRLVKFNSSMINNSSSKVTATPSFNDRKRGPMQLNQNP